jgi:hypothetical protein
MDTMKRLTREQKLAVSFNYISHILMSDALINIINDDNLRRWKTNTSLESLQKLRQLLLFSLNSCTGSGGDIKKQLSKVSDFTQEITTHILQGQEPYKITKKQLRAITKPFILSLDLTSEKTKKITVLDALLDLHVSDNTHLGVIAFKLHVFFTDLTIWLTSLNTMTHTTGHVKFDVLLGNIMMSNIKGYFQNGFPHDLLFYKAIEVQKGIGLQFRLNRSISCITSNSSQASNCSLIDLF